MIIDFRSEFYMKNLGTSDAVTNMYGTGTNVDQLLSGTAELTKGDPARKP